MKSPLVLDKNLAKLILGWCQNKFGKSKFDARTPKIRLYKATKDDYGMYTSQTCSISLYNGSIQQADNPLEEFVNTIIHEYFHYLQPIDQCYDALTTYFGGYNNNPLEKQANEAAKQYVPEVLVYLISQLG